MSVKHAGENESKSESRLHGAAKILGGITVSASVTLGIKALIPVVFAVAAPPAVAVIGIPLGMAALSSYGILKSAKGIKERLRHHKHNFNEQGLSGGKAVLMAMKQNKFALGAFAGSLGLLAMGLATDLGHLIGAAVSEAAQTATAEASAVATFITEAIEETTIAGADKIIEHGPHHQHKEKFPFRTGLRSKFARTAHKTAATAQVAVQSAAQDNAQDNTPKPRAPSPRQPS
jgi:hypothetical protein